MGRNVRKYIGLILSYKTRFQHIKDYLKPRIYLLKGTLFIIACFRSSWLHNWKTEEHCTCRCIYCIHLTLTLSIATKMAYMYMHTAWIHLRRRVILRLRRILYVCWHIFHQFWSTLKIIADETFSGRHFFDMYSTDRDISSSHRSPYQRLYGDRSFSVSNHSKYV